MGKPLGAGEHMWCVADGEYIGLGACQGPSAAASVPSHSLMLCTECVGEGVGAAMCARGACNADVPGVGASTAAAAASASCLNASSAAVAAAGCVPVAIGSAFGTAAAAGKGVAAAFCAGVAAG